MTGVQQNTPTKAVEKRLKIVGCTPVYTAKHDNGTQFSIYEVQAEREDGEAVPATLRSYEDLPLEWLDVLVTKRSSQRYGDSYMLASKDRNPTRARVAALEDRVKGLEETVEALLETMASGA